MAKVDVVTVIDQMSIERVAVAPYGTNAYIISCRHTGENALIDAPGEPKVLLELLRRARTRYILLTHGHPDHTGALIALRDELDVPVCAHEGDASKLPLVPDRLLRDGDVLPLGHIGIEVLHTPGHTKGSLCFAVQSALLAGDTLFPGGPGKTRGPAEFQQIVASITERIFALPDDTRVLPGHGEFTVLGKEKQEYAAFAARPHDPNLSGDILWLTS